MVKRERRKKPEGKNNGTSQTANAISGSRFNVLESMGNEDGTSTGMLHADSVVLSPKGNGKEQTGSGGRSSGYGVVRKVLAESDKNNRGTNGQREGFEKNKMRLTNMQRGNNMSGSGFRGSVGKENVRGNEGGKNVLKGSSSKGVVGNENSVFGGRESLDPGEGSLLARMRELGERRSFNVKSKPPDVTKGEVDGNFQKVVPMSRGVSPVLGDNDVSMVMD